MRINNLVALEEIQQHDLLYYVSDEEQKFFSQDSYDQECADYEWRLWKAATTPTVAVCPVWKDPETHTVVVLGALHGRRNITEFPVYYSYMGDAKRQSRMLMEDKVINANILLGKSWWVRKGERLSQYALRLYEDVDYQISDGVIIGEGNLSHLCAAARLIQKIIKHYERKGFKLNLHFVGSDARRSRAYFWLAKKLGAQIENLQGLEDEDPSFNYITHTGE